MKVEGRRHLTVHFVLAPIEGEIREIQGVEGIDADAFSAPKQFRLSLAAG